MEWINIKDGLPNKDCIVLALVQWNEQNSSKEIILLSFEVKDNYFIQDEGCCGRENITGFVHYWMPIDLIQLPSGWLV